MIALGRTQPFYGLKFTGTSFDCGSKEGFLTANIAYALARPDMAQEVHRVLQEILQLDAAPQERIPTEQLAPTAASDTERIRRVPALPARV